MTQPLQFSFTRPEEDEEEEDKQLGRPVAPTPAGDPAKEGKYTFRAPSSTVDIESNLREDPELMRRVSDHKYGPPAWAQAVWPTDEYEEDEEPSRFQRGVDSAMTGARMGLGTVELIGRGFTTELAQLATAPINWITGDEEAASAQKAFNWLAGMTDLNGNELEKKRLHSNSLHAWAIGEAIGVGRGLFKVLDRANDASDMDAWWNAHLGIGGMLQQVKQVDAVHDWMEASNNEFYERWGDIHSDIQKLTPKLRNISPEGQAILAVAASASGNDFMARLALMPEEDRMVIDQWVSVAQGAGMEATGFLDPSTVIAAPLKAVKVVALAGLATRFGARRIGQLNRLRKFGAELGHVATSVGSSDDFVRGALIGNISEADAALKGEEAVMAGAHQAAKVHKSLPFEVLPEGKFLDDDDVITSMLGQVRGGEHPAQIQPGGQLMTLMAESEDANRAALAVAGDASRYEEFLELDQHADNLATRLKVLTENTVEELGQGAHGPTLSKLRQLQAAEDYTRHTRHRMMELARVQDDLSVLVTKWEGKEPARAAAFHEAKMQIERGLRQVIPGRNPTPYIPVRGEEGLHNHIRNLAHIWSRDAGWARVMGGFRANSIAQAVDIPFKPILGDKIRGAGKRVLYGDQFTEKVADIENAHALGMKYGRDHGWDTAEEIAENVQADAGRILRARILGEEVSLSELNRLKKFPFYEQGWRVNPRTGEKVPGLKAVMDDAESMMNVYVDEIDDVTMEIMAASETAGSRNVQVLEGGERQKRMGKKEWVQKIMGDAKMPLGHMIQNVEEHLGQLKAAKNIVREMVASNYPSADGLPVFIRDLNEVGQQHRHNYSGNTVTSPFLQDALPGEKGRVIYMHKAEDGYLKSFLTNPQTGLAKFDDFMGTSKSIHYFYSAFHSITLAESAMASNGVIDGLRMWRAGGFGLPKNIARDPRIMASPERAEAILAQMLKLDQADGSPTQIQKLREALGDNSRKYQERIREMLEAETQGRKQYEILIGDFLNDGGLYTAPKLEYIQGAPEKVFGWVGGKAEGLMNRLLGPGSFPAARKVGRKGLGGLEGGAMHLEMGLWNQFQGPVKVATYHMLKQHLLAAKRGEVAVLAGLGKKLNKRRLADMTDIELGREAAKFVNDEFGSQNWALHNNRALRQLANKQVTQVARFFESVDWNLSAMRQNWASFQGMKTLGKITAKMGARPSQFHGLPGSGIYNPARGLLGLRHSRNTVLQLALGGSAFNYMFTGLSSTAEDDEEIPRWSLMKKDKDGNWKWRSKNERRARFMWENPSGERAKVATGMKDPFTGKRIYLRPFKALHDAAPWVWSFMEANNFNPFTLSSWQVPTEDFETYFRRKISPQIRVLVEDELYGDDAEYMAELRRQGEGLGVKPYVFTLFNHFKGGYLPFAAGYKVGQGRFGLTPGEEEGPPADPFRWVGFKALPYQTTTGMTYEEAKILLSDLYASDDDDSAAEIDQVISDLLWEGWKLKDAVNLNKAARRAADRRARDRSPRKGKGPRVYGQ